MFLTQDELMFLYIVLGDFYNETLKRIKNTNNPKSYENLHKELEMLESISHKLGIKTPDEVKSSRNKNVCEVIG